MPSPSKFRYEAQQRALQILRSGGSRRAAAKAAGVSWGTFHRWLSRGKAGAPGGRWREFYEAVRQAEGTPPELVAIQDEFERAMADPVAAMAWLEQQERRDVVLIGPDEREPDA